MFGRKSSSDNSEATPGSTKVGGKGRPTPTRKEAEAAARARAKPPKTRKERAAAARAAEKSATKRINQPSSKEIREGMKRGEEKYLLPRDKGPVRRFTRDFVDRRFSFVEMMIPLLILTLVLSYSGSEQLASTGNTILLMMVLLIGIDIVVLRRKLFSELDRRFPEEPRKGLTYYAVTRSLQMKFMRLPKAQVKIGDELPERYR